MSRLKYGFRNRIQASLGRLPGGPLFALLLTELTTLYYALVAPWRDSEAPSEALVIPMDGGGYRTTFKAILVVAVLELVGMHLLLEYLASSMIAWIVTGLSIYGMLFLIADFNSLQKRPAMIYENVLYLYIGLRWRGEYPLARIENVEPVNFRNEEAPEGAAELDLALLGGANLRVCFADDQEIRGPFGIRRRCRSLKLTVDDPAAVEQALGVPPPIS